MRFTLLDSLLQVLIYGLYVVEGMPLGIVGNRTLQHSPSKVQWNMGYTTETSAVKELIALSQPQVGTQCSA